MKKQELDKDKEAIKSLTELVKNLEIRLKKSVTENLNKVTKMEKSCNETMVKLSKKTQSFNKNDKAIKKALLTQLQAFKGIEETFYILYHNIQKNQYLYATEPEAWWKDYLDLKNRYKNENKEFEDKCKDVEERFFANIFYKIIDEKWDKEEFLID